MSDVRFAVRALRAQPGFTLAALLALTFGIGSTTAIFTVVNSVLLRPLPLLDSGRIVWMWTGAGTSLIMRAGLAPEDFADFERDTTAFSSLGAFQFGSWNVTGDGPPSRLVGVRVSEKFFSTLGVSPALGRTFDSGDFESGRDDIAILSYAYWQRELGGGADALGRKLMMDGKPFVIVGVMPPEFAFPKDCEMWAPFGRDRAQWKGRFSRALRVVGRLKPGVSVEQAQADVTRVSKRLAATFPDTHSSYDVRLVTLQDEEVGGARQTLMLFLAAVGLVLLIACTNVAGLMLARGIARRKEFAIRQAVGAGRGRLIRQVLVEASVLSLLGGAFGLLSAQWSLKLVMALNLNALPRAAEIRLDPVVFAFAVFISLLTGVLFGLTPALKVAYGDPHHALTESGRGSTAGTGRQRVRTAIVTAEVALSVMLLVVTVLVARSVRAMLAEDPGFEASQVLTMQVTLTDPSYNPPSKRIQFFEQVLDRLRELPGVQAAGAINYLPMSGQRVALGFWTTPQAGPAAEMRSASVSVTAPGYFRAMGIPLKAGRYLDGGGRRPAPYDLVVNEAFARRFFGGDAVGKRLTLETGTTEPAEIVGVVGDTRQQGLYRAAQPEMYTVVTQTPIAGMTLVVRAAGNPETIAASVRQAVSSVDRSVPVFNFRPMTRLISESVSQPRFRALVLTVFSAVSLVLAGLGVYGVVSYAVNERLNEIGIRVALGALPADVVRLVVGHSLKLTVAGLVAGMAASAAVSRLLSGILYGVSALDPLTYAAAALLFSLIAILASLIPALRALRVDPVDALRAQ